MRSAVGLAIRANWVEVLEVERGFRKSATVSKYGRFPLVSTEKTKVVEAIQGALEAAKIKTNEVVLAIPTQEVILRYFILPQLPKNEWSGAVQFEARKYIPFKLEELVWDYHVSERKADRQLDIIFVGTRKEVYAEYMALLTQAGLKAMAIEAASFSVARAVVYSYPKFRNETFAAIDVCGDMAHVALIHNGIPEVARDVYLAGGSDYQSVEQMMQPMEAAEMPPPAYPDPNAASEIPVPAMPSEQEEQFANLVSELKLSLDYFAREFVGQEVNQILLCGEGATEEWRRALADELKLPVELATSNPIEGEKEPLKSQWTLTLGLALHTAGVLGPTVNFLRHRGVASDPVTLAADADKLKPLIWEAGLVCAALAALFTYTLFELKQAYVQVSQVQAERESLNMPMELATPAIVRQMKKNVDARLALLEDVVGHPFFMTPKVAVVPMHLPQAVWLKELTIRPTGRHKDRLLKMAMSGYSYMQSLSGSQAIVNNIPAIFKADTQFMKGFAVLTMDAVGVSKIDGNDVTTFTLSAVQADSKKAGDAGER